MLTLDRRFLLMAVAAGLPAVVIALVLLWTGTYPLPYKWGLTVATVALWLGCTYGLRQRIARPLRTISACWQHFARTTSPSGREGRARGIRLAPFSSK